MGALKKFIPIDVNIRSPTEVKNGYKLSKEQLRVDPEYARNNPPIPLIAIDILKGGKMFVYSTDPNAIVDKTT